ncbi:MAG: hypothetical protein IH589_17800 [Anaerolineales bacterium]|nr:hypothetical protein [Anaerolineales bacterium]
MSSYTMRLLKCPACGGPIDPPGGESTIKCPYCGNAVMIPESLRKPDPNQKQMQGGLLNGMDMSAVMGYGSQWSEVVQLAQSEKKDEAIKKYMSFASVRESDARYTVEALAGAQTYEFTPGSAYTSVQIAPIMASYADTAKSVTKWSMWLGCGITAFVMFIIVITVLPILIGVFASLWAVFSSF